jgi:ParB family transcriptional regulator, chromosome partitioning protein
MSKPTAKQLEVLMGQRRSPDAIEEDMKSTILGQLAQESQAPIDIPVEQIRPSPFQRRGEFNQEDIENLASSIAEGGLVTPIIVRKLPGDQYELITGHKRTAAFKHLNRARIPAIVRVLSDTAAARALTSDNTLHKGLTDWELYKHAAMLREGRHVKNAADLAAVLGVARTTVYNLEAFGELPAAAHAMLDENPGLIGGNVAYGLREVSKSSPDAVVSALKLVKDGKLKQMATLQWIERKLGGSEHKPAPARHELSLGDESLPVRLVAVGNEIKLSGELDIEKLAALIQANLTTLKKLS